MESHGNLQLIPILILAALFWWWTSCASVQLADDRLDDFLQLLLLSLEVFEVGVLVGLEPLDLFFHGFLDGLLVVGGELASQLLLVSHLVLERVRVTLELVTGVDALFQPLVFVCEALGVVHHALDVFGRQPILVVGDGDLVLVARAFVFSRHPQDAVDVDFKRDFNLRNATGCWGDTRQVKGSQEVVVFGQRTLTWEKEKKTKNKNRLPQGTGRIYQNDFKTKNL